MKFETSIVEAILQDENCRDQEVLACLAFITGQAAIYYFHASFLMEEARKYLKGLKKVNPKLFEEKEIDLEPIMDRVVVGPIDYFEKLGFGSGVIIAVIPPIYQKKEEN